MNINSAGLCSLFYWLLLIPFCIGLIPMQWIPEKKRNAGTVLIAGYLILLPLCWVVTVPCILLVKYESFLVMVRYFFILSMAAALSGVLMTIYAKKKKGFVPLPSLKETVIQIKRMSWTTKVMWILFFCLLGWQLYKAFTMMSFDGDDAEYVAQSLVTEQSNTMYRIKPYTGGTTDLDIRHSLAVLPIWVAFLGRMSGIHTTIIAHSILPLLWIPLTYLVFYEIGKHLLGKRKEYLPGFMALMALLQMFGNVSIYTNETFFLTRTWQGKAVAVSFVIPVTLWLLLCLFDKEKDGDNDRQTLGAGKESAGGLWALLCLANMTAGVCTSMVVFLNAILIAAVAFWVMVAERKFSILVKAGLACIPNAIYMALYLFLHI